MSRPRRRIREELLNSEEPTRRPHPHHDAALALTMLPGLHLLHAHLRWTMESVSWLDLAVRTSAAMTRMGDALPPQPAPASSHAVCVVIDFPRARSKRLTHRVR